MTLTELERIVVRLANFLPTRCWAHHSEPGQVPWLMAVKVYPMPGPNRAGKVQPSAELHGEMLGLGFCWDVKFQLWTIERTDEDGSPLSEQPMVLREELAQAATAILRAKAIATKIRAIDDGIVTPKGLAWEKAKEMAYAAEALAYHATWMRNELLKRAR